MVHPILDRRNVYAELFTRVNGYLLTGMKLSPTRDLHPEGSALLRSAALLFAVIQLALLSGCASAPKKEPGPFDTHFDCIKMMNGQSGW